MSVATAPVLEATGLAIAIGGREVVSDVSLAVAPGECVGLVGESGSGKSVTCRALTGLLGRIGGELVRGAVRVDGRDMAGAREREWRALRGRTIGLVPQASLAALDPVMRVEAQLAETIRVHDRGADARERAGELLEQVEIADVPTVLRQYPHELSGGMRQRVMIALALAARPRVLICDESTTALDVTVQRAILRLLDDLRRTTDVALVFVTHDLSVVRAIADRVTVMYGGMAFEQGPRDAVLDRPLNPYTRALLDADPAAVERGLRLRGLPGTPPDPEDWAPGCRFAPRCPHHAERCDAARPAIEPAGDGRAVACVRWKELSL